MFHKFAKTISIGFLSALPGLAQIPTGVSYAVIYDPAQVSFNQPTFVGPVPGDAGQLIVIERPGAVWRLVKNGTLFEKKAWFSVAANTDTHWDGAWALEFHPRFASNRLFYVLYRLKGTDTRSVIEEWTCDAGFANPRKVRNVIFFNQKSIHSSGDIKFSPVDGFLYSSQGDRAQTGANGGQLMSELWGKVIRIDVDNKDAGLEYAIPADNPFRTQAGTRPEIWASGFRMPFRISFDKLNGDLYLGDVGDVTAEEVNLVEARKNYGSGTVEGTCKANCTGLTDPIANLPHGCVIGGVVYRNDPTSAFYGAYIFADYQINRVSAFKINATKTGVTDHKQIATTPPGRISAMGHDAAGNIYIATYLETPENSRTHIYRLQHAELRPAPVSVAGPAARPSLTVSREDLASGRFTAFALDGKALSPASAKAPAGDLLLLREGRSGAVRKWVRLP